MAIWTEETEDQMISMIQDRPALYDVSDKRYANRAVKRELWREIANKLVLSGKIFFLAIHLFSSNRVCYCQKPSLKYEPYFGYYWLIFG